MSVRCGKLPYRFAPSTESKKHPRIEGYENINVTSASRQKWANLSPMKLRASFVEELAPNLYYPSGVLPGFSQVDSTHQASVVSFFENYWQYAKIYDVDLSFDGTLLPSFFERRREGLQLDKPKRRALPKAKARPVASFFNGRIYSYLEARIYVYCPVYATLVQQRLEYVELVDKYSRGENLHIIGFDGRDVGPITPENMLREILRTDVPFGHELVLSCLLAGLHPWLDARELVSSGAYYDPNAI